MTWLYVPACALSPFAAASADWSLACDSQRVAELASSVMWRGKHLPPASWPRVLKKASFVTHLSFQTSSASTLNRGAARWIASLPAIPASHLATPAAAKAPKTRATSGRTSQLTFGFCAPATFSAKTSPDTLPWGSNRSAKTYAAWAIALRQVYSARQKLALRTCASDSSLLPTPQATTHHEFGGPARGGDGRYLTLFGMAQQGRWPMMPTPTAVQYGHNLGGSNGRVGTPRYSLGSMASKGMWPTPTSVDGTAGCGPTNFLRDELPLREAVKITPEQLEAHRQQSQARRKAMAASRLWPTPTATDSVADGPANHKRRWPPLRAKAAASTPAPGALSADWVSLLQGLPPWWTTLPKDGLATGKMACLESPQVSLTALTG